MKLFFWKQSEHSGPIVLHGKRECQKLLQERGGRAFMEVYTRKGLERVIPIKLKKTQEAQYEKKGIAQP